MTQGQEMAEIMIEKLNEHFEAKIYTTVRLIIP